MRWVYRNGQFEPVVNEVLTTGEPVKIIKHAGNAILVSEEVWRGLTETLNLVSILACEASYAPECVNLLRSQQKVWIDKMDAFLMNFIGLVWLLEDTSV